MIFNVDHAHRYAKARHLLQKRGPRELLRGKIRESMQWSLDDHNTVRYDFAFRDPASGRVTQYGCDAHFRYEMSEDQHREMVFEPCLARIAMMIQMKCGIARAIENQIPLSLPRDVRARYI
jgi:hypothetical protein